MDYSIYNDILLKIQEEMPMDGKEHSEQYARQVMHEFRRDIDQLKPYVAYLERLSGKDAAHPYTGDGIGDNSMPVPVFDANLLAFVKKAASCKTLMDRNYPYIYSRYGFKTHEDELNAIEQATYQDVHILKGILSYYVQKGMVKGAYWVEAVEKGIFCKVIKKFDDLMEQWK